MIIAVEAGSDVLKDLAGHSTPDVIIGPPTLASSPVDALDTPLTADDVKTIAEVCVVVFKAATALTVFVSTLIASIRARPDSTATIRDPQTNKVRARVTAHTTETELLAALQEN